MLLIPTLIEKKFSMTLDSFSLNKLPTSITGISSRSACPSHQNFKLCQKSLSSLVGDEQRKRQNRWFSRKPLCLSTIKLNVTTLSLSSLESRSFLPKVNSVQEATVSELRAVHLTVLTVIYQQERLTRVAVILVLQFKLSAQSMDDQSLCYTVSSLTAFHCAVSKKEFPVFTRKSQNTFFGS